jgi:hypothetical protein
MCSSGAEIHSDSYEKYISYPHLAGFYKKLSGFIINLEVHLSTLSSPEFILSPIDLFEDAVELTLGDGHTIVTLSYDRNFLSLINHFIRHVLQTLITDLWERNFIYGYNFSHIKELHLFFERYKSSIDIDVILDFANRGDTIENVELFNRHYKELYGIEIFPSEKLKKMRNKNLYLQKQFCRYLLNLSIENLNKMDIRILLMDFRKSFIYTPSKIISLTAGQKFTEYLCLTNGFVYKGFLYPECTLRHDGKNIFFMLYLMLIFFLANPCISIWLYKKRMIICCWLMILELI